MLLVVEFDDAEARARAPRAETVARVADAFGLAIERRTTDAVERVLNRFR